MFRDEGDTNFGVAVISTQFALNNLIDKIIPYLISLYIYASQWKHSGFVYGPKNN